MTTRGITNPAGSIALVTGGARGIGAATAHELAGSGVHVAIGDIDADLAGRTAAEFSGLAVTLDVTDPASWAAAIATIEAELGPIDILVNNAGIMPIGPFTAETDAITQRQLDINVAGVLFGCKAVIPGMRARGHGHLINIASQAGKMGLAGAVTYHATKHAVVGLSQALDDELKDDGIAVTCVLPGIVNTELARGLEPSILTPRVEPADIARAIGRAVRKPRAEVWLPRSGVLLTAVVRHAPLEVRRAVMRVMNRVDPMLTVDPATRAAYEQRAAGPVE